MKCFKDTEPMPQDLGPQEDLERKECFFFQKWCACVFCVGGVYVSAGNYRGQRALNPLKLDLQVVVSHLIWVLGTEFRLFARVMLHF